MTGDRTVEIERLLEGRAGLRQPSLTLEGQTQAAAPGGAIGLALHRLAEGLGRLAMTLESPEDQGEAAIEASGLRVASDRVTIAGRRLAPTPGPAERDGQVHERPVGGRLDAQRLREGLGRLAMTTLADQGEAASDMRHGVARRKARRLAEGRLGLDEAPETVQRPSEVLVRLGERGEAGDGAPERRLLVVGPGLTATHERLSKMRKAVARLEARRFGIGGLGLGPAPLPLEGHPSLKWARGARGESSRATAKLSAASPKRR